MNILLIGGTGLVGKLTLKYLLQDLRVRKIIVLSRYKIDQADDRIINIVGDLFHMNEATVRDHQINKIDITLCALGTTIKKVGTKEAFKKVDLDLVVQMANLAHSLESFHFSVISAQGASLSSPFFYSRIKAQMEEAIKKIDFKHITIIRPGLLVGERTETRIVERAFIKMNPILKSLLVGNLKQYRPIKAETVAYFLAQSGFETNFGIRYIENLNLLEN